MSALAACFPKALLQIPETVRATPVPANATENNHVVSGQSPNPIGSSDPREHPVDTRPPASPNSTASATPEPLVTVDRPELAEAKPIVLDETAKKELPVGTLTAIEVRYVSSEATPSQTTKMTLAVASEWWPPYSKDHKFFPLAKLKKTSEGIPYLETASVDAVDEMKKTVTFTPKDNGVYVIVSSEQEPKTKQDFPYYEGIEGRQTYQYDPAQDKFVVGGSGTHTSSRPHYSVLTDADIASASVLFSPGDGHDKEAGNWHALKFYRYAYHYAKPEDRAWTWKRMMPMVVVYDTRPSIDRSAELAAPYVNMRIGFSYGALRNRAGMAIARKRLSNQPFDSREVYLHHFGDISWAGEHLGVKIADPKAWRASSQGRPYATGLALAHGAFFHNLSTPLTLRPLKNMEDPIRDLGVSWQAYGHRSFFPPARRYPIQYPFITLFRFGRIGGIPWPEELSPDDAYSIPCSEASKYFTSAAEATKAIIGGECRYNFFQALEWMEGVFGSPREIRYAGYFADIPELVRAHREFAGLVATNIADTIQWKDRSAVSTRRALAWMQAEQALPPHNLPCGDGIADCASALGYEGGEPLVLRSGAQLGINAGALGRAKPAGIKYRLIRNASHADFAGKGSDNPHTFTETERAIYDSTLADLRELDTAAFAPAPSGNYSYATEFQQGIRAYLQSLGYSDSQFEFTGASPTTPGYAYATFYVKKRVPQDVFHYVDERNDHYRAEFRWWNGRWWFDGKGPQVEYSEYINRG